MPRKAQNLTPKERDKWFVSLFLDKYGADEAKVPLVEKRAGLKPGFGQRILKRKSVKDEIHKRLEPVRFEQFRQQVLTEAAVMAKAGLQKDLKDQVDTVRRLKIEVDVLDHELMAGVIGLDWQLHPKEKLEVIKAAYVVNGTMESGNTRLLIPKEGALGGDASLGTYTSLFNRLAAPPPASDAAAALSGKVFDLIPPARPSKSTAPPDATLPPPGESIVEAPPAKPKSRVITVEVG